jgi:hypothetical protein
LALQSTLHVGKRQFSCIVTRSETNLWSMDDDLSLSLIGSRNSVIVCPSMAAQYGKRLWLFGH